MMNTDSSSWLSRVLHRTGVLPLLRAEWRAEQRQAAEKAEARLSKGLAETKGRVEAVASTADRRLMALELEVRRLQAILAFDAEHRERRHRHDVFETDPVAAQVYRAIGAAPLADDPMPHLIIENLLPMDVYQALLDGIPPVACFSQKDRAKQDFKLAQADAIPEWTRVAFGFLDTSLISSMLVPALVQRFEPHIRAAYDTTYGPRLGPRVAELPHVASAGRLMLRRPGYHLNPHLDPRRVVVTCLLYLARPGDSELFGTTFFRIDGTPVVDQRSTYYPEENGLACTIVKAAPFRPNSAVAFLNARGCAWR